MVNNARAVTWLLVLALQIAGACRAGPPPAARLVLVLVVDGLRPDSINPTDTPTLFQLQQEGVSYSNSHAVFPTATRVNAAALATGTYPGTNGLVGNDMYVAAANPAAPLSTADWRQLVRLEDVSGGRILLAPSLVEFLEPRGLRFVALSSATPGTALILNPRAHRGLGVSIHGYLDPGVLAAYPQAVNEAVLERIGPPPASDAPMEIAEMSWTDDVLRDYVLPELRPDVVVDWLAGPDASQHAFGVGSPEARKALRANDDSIARTLQVLDGLGRLSRTDVIVVSDHGFGHNARAVNVADALVSAGLKTARDSTDVVVANNGPAVLLYVRERDRPAIERVVGFLQTEAWADVVFTRGASPASPLGQVEGTFSLDLLRLDHPDRGPDVVVTLPWTTDPNPYGVAGAHATASGTRNGPLEGAGGGHGGLAPFVVRNTLLAWGPGFRRGVVIAAPAGIVDVAPTILALLGVERPKSIEGRVLAEALATGDPTPPGQETATFTTKAGAYEAAVQVSRAGGHQYVDRAWRVRAK